MTHTQFTRKGPEPIASTYHEDAPGQPKVTTVRLEQGRHLVRVKGGEGDHELEIAVRAPDGTVGTARGRTLPVLKARTHVEAVRWAGAHVLRLDGRTA